MAGPSQEGALLCAGLRDNHKEAEGEEALLSSFTQLPADTVTAMWVLAVDMFGAMPFLAEISFKQLILLFKTLLKYTADLLGWEED